MLAGIPQITRNITIPMYYQDRIKKLNEGENESLQWRSY